VVKVNIDENPITIAGSFKNGRHRNHIPSPISASSEARMGEVPAGRRGTGSIEVLHMPINQGGIDGL
jgi:hypothetical protein